MFNRPFWVSCSRTHVDWVSTIWNCIQFKCFNQWSLKLFHFSFYSINTNFKSFYQTYELFRNFAIVINHFSLSWIISHLHNFGNCFITSLLRRAHKGTKFCFDRHILESGIFEESFYTLLCFRSTFWNFWDYIRIVLHLNITL